MQQERDSFSITVYKNILPRIFLKFSAERDLYSLGHIFSKVNRGIVQKPDEVGTLNWLGR